ncbi:Putative insertion element ISCmi2 transposase [Propionibacterium freudenreichii]|uniref:Integrase, catalytic region n=3 Tax=Propionibacterium freudenreichii TaxID=1744 RepID=D7GI37_PROFC|nr:Integrase, catalytic region [Propionibacterium freudenreichii subsp. shermanii CIRM-BIA1]SCQ62068.1 Putative insertion element ISCmi2 transposase [Propionibacterium freudenreichii]SCQ71743.1 Putative insertion element ISCmi2 transposase [Propionibacterium freudenreichii]SCQ74383.1 Putative insertion element ISCmi2 transposase [Propionibacterium freudenreichii]
MWVTTLTLLTTEVFVTHANAPLTPEGRRRLAVLVVEQGWSLRRAAERFQCSPATVKRWADRYRAGLPVRRPKPKRYEVAAPGQLVHVDIKKQGRIPDGGGWRAHGRGSMQDRHAGVARDKAARAGAAGSRGYRYLHHAVDDHSRIAYSEILDDERRETAAGFWTRANAFFAGLGVTVTAVMTDNGSCYRSGAFADALGDEVKHKWTRPYRPQTNGKVERFNRTLAVEWAYAKPYASEAERAAAYETWLHHYNHHRPHTGIGGQTPSARVHNVTGKYS